MGITINEYRPNQVEVMFEDDVLVDTVEMENKINSMFRHFEWNCLNIREHVCGIVHS